jgi:hypothetical protein
MPCLFPVIRFPLACEQVQQFFAPMSREIQIPVCRQLKPTYRSMLAPRTRRGLAHAVRLNLDLSVKNPVAKLTKLLANVVQ